MFPIYPIDRLQAEGIEYLGTKRKFWFTLNKKRYLFKAEERGTGEDWAEKIVCELSRRIGLPHVEYELAHEYEGFRAIQPGVICPSFASRPLALVMGNQLLFQRDPNYPAEKENKYGVREYTVDAVAATVSGLEPPAPIWMQGTPEGIAGAIDVFCGYLLLDTWVANQDRHHLNWGAIQDTQGVRSLAPTYDHGSSLARNLLDDERKDRLQTRDKNRTVKFFAARARSGFYAPAGGGKTMFALDVFRWFADRQPVAARIWLGQLNATGSDVVDAILAEIPPERMSPTTKEFTQRLLAINREKLLEGFSP